MRFTLAIIIIQAVAFLAATGFTSPDIHTIRADEVVNSTGSSNKSSTDAFDAKTIGLADLPERSNGGGQFMFIDRVPVLCVSGDPKEIGRQTAQLLGKKVERLLDYPRFFLHGNDKAENWQKMVSRSRDLWKNAPDDHRKELDAFVAASGIDRNTLLVGNLMMDIYRGMGCASLIVESSRSKSGSPMFGRNLDFYGGGILHKYSLVSVYRPQGKHAFATVGFAGLFGCLTGINDAGLTIAVHEVMVARDGSKLFNPTGVPYTFAFRRILEECDTAEEAEKLIRNIKRTTKLNLAVCDRQKSFVLEMTPKSVVRRDPKNGICVCTNHFCTPQLMIFPFCQRFAALDKIRELDKVSLTDVAVKMHAANAGTITLQTMIFEPRALRLHLSVGNLPASAGPYHTLDLQSLLAAEPPATVDHRTTSKSR